MDRSKSERQLAMLSRTADQKLTIEGRAIDRKLAMDSRSVSRQLADMERALGKLCTQCDHLAHQLDCSASSAHLSSTRNIFQSLLRKMVKLYDHLMPDCSNGRGVTPGKNGQQQLLPNKDIKLRDEDNQNKSKELVGECDYDNEVLADQHQLQEKGGEKEQNEQQRSEDEASADESADCFSPATTDGSDVHASDAKLSRQMSFRAPMPKGRILEIIASLKRASEQQKPTASQLMEHQLDSEAVDGEQTTPSSDDTPPTSHDAPPTQLPTSHNAEPTQYDAPPTSHDTELTQYDAPPTSHDAPPAPLPTSHDASFQHDAPPTLHDAPLTSPVALPTSSLVAQTSPCSDSMGVANINQSSNNNITESNISEKTSECSVGGTQFVNKLELLDLESTAPSQLPTCSIPVAPPPPLAPPPPPLATQMSIPRHQPQYWPSVDLKPLFWRKLQYSAVEISGRDIVWGNTSEPALVEVKEFENLFKKSRVVKKSERRSHDINEHNSSRPIRLLDGHRSQAVGILLKSLHVDLDEITQAVVAMETGLVDVESLKALNEMKATNEELSKIRAHLHGNSKQPLDKPEVFLYRLSQISHFSERLNCLLFSCTFAESASAMSHKLNTIQKACNSLRQSKPLHEVLGLILALGNIMNAGSKVRGQADGFDLNVLPQLMDIKSSLATPTNTTTFLQFIVCYFIKYKCPSSSSVFPLPDPSTALAASQIKFDDLHVELELLTKQMSVAKSNLKVVAKETLNHDQQTKSFLSQMQQFLSQSVGRLAEMSTHLSSAEKQFQKTVNYFCVQAPCGEGHVSPAHFFGLWSPFLREFQRLWTIEMKSKALARQKAAQQERWASVVVKPVSQTGLKSRLKLLHSSSTSS